MQNQERTHRDDVRTVYTSGATTRSTARKALRDAYAADRGLSFNARDLFARIKEIQTVHNTAGGTAQLEEVTE